MDLTPVPSVKSNRVPSRLAIACAITLASMSATSLRAQYDVSAPATLQMFESSWITIQRRAPDIFMAGYGAVQIPPGYRADSGNQSVGYDVYDRFDLGNADSPTLYGTENTLKRSIVETRRAGLSTYADLIWNHDGFSSYSDATFANAGGYQSFVAGDFHDPSISADTNQYDGRTSGLLDINQASNNVYVRNPIPNVKDVNGNALTNIPKGTTPGYGRLANQPDNNNRRFYQDRNRAPDRTINGTAMYNFTTDTLTTGDAVAENAVGYLMRHEQWMLQSIGVDGFRLDAAKHVPNWVFNDYFDLAASGANPRKNLDGSTKSVFSYGEIFDTNKSYVQTYIRKDTTGNETRNRDALDFNLYYAINQNLTSNGLSNDWRNVVNASLDSQDDGLANNGSQGVGFVASHDSFGPDLSNVAHAYALMRPGNQIVYFNAKEFGNGRDFPKDGRGDALGGQYGNAITTLTNLRATHGRGNYLERWLSKEDLVYERDRSAVVALSNRTDGGYDALTVQTNFTPGTRLIEMTGNAANAVVDPTGQIADYVVVDGNGKISFNAPRNANVNGVAHNNGYLVYGLPTPVGTLTIPDKNRTVAGGTPTASTNGTTRLASLDVVTANSFTINLQTSAPIIGGYTDTQAGGDNALFSINSGVDANGNGLDLNGSGLVDYRTPGSVVYGFEEFTTKKSPLVAATAGDGEYKQVVDATKLVEGFNYLEVRAFRARTDGGPPVYSSFKKIVYVDRFKPVSNFDVVKNSGGNDRAIRIANPDGTADSVQVFLDTGAALSEAQTLALVNGGSGSTQIDANLWSKTFGNVGTGNHSVSIVTYEPSGNYSVKRLSGLFIQTGRGLGVGDVNYDNVFNGADTTGAGSFDTYLYSRGTQFNAASDVNADGLIDNRDLFALPALYTAAGASAAATAAQAAVVRRGNVNGDAFTSAADIDFLFGKVGATGDTWLYDLNTDGVVTRADVDTLVGTILLTHYGDANLDRNVNFGDLLDVAQHYGQPGTWATCDFTGDGMVDFSDLLALAQNYGQGSAVVSDPSFTATFASDWALAQSLLPEPTAIAGLAMAALASGRRRLNR